MIVVDSAALMTTQLAAIKMTSFMETVFWRNAVMAFSFFLFLFGFAFAYRHGTSGSSPTTACDGSVKNFSLPAACIDSLSDCHAW